MGNTIDGSNDVDANGKYLLLSVPKFRQDPISGKEMTSYLRLGASSSTWEQDPGGDLAKNVNLAGPTGGPPTPDATAVSGTGDDPRPVFIDDLRVRDGFAGPHTLGVGERVAQSEVLNTRGGWRDHSDGNRISTTYGDKIEVIRGNYKMVVLGRQDDESKAAGLDISGQHLQPFAYTNPSLLRISWTQDLGGVWHIEDTSEGVVHSVNFAGDEYEFKWGKRFESTTGSDCPMDKDAASGGTRLNPVIIEKTWAERIESYTGNAKLPVPLIQDETWAECITSTTNADATTETTTVTGAITSSTTSGSTTETTSSGAITSTTTAGSITETTTVGDQTGTTIAGAIIDTTVVGAQVGTTVAGAVVDTAIVGANVSIFVGTDWSLAFGTSFELFAGLAKIGIAYSTLGILDLAFATTTITSVKSASAGIIDVTLTPTKVEVDNTPDKIELTLGNVTDVDANEISLRTLTQQIAAAHFHF